MTNQNLKEAREKAAREKAAHEVFVQRTYDGIVLILRALLDTESKEFRDYTPEELLAHVQKLIGRLSPLERSRFFESLFPAE